VSGPVLSSQMSIILKTFAPLVIYACSEKNGSPVCMTCNENVTSTSRYDARQETNKTGAPTICLLAAKGKQIRDGANCVHPMRYNCYVLNERG
jgi:hypothetical protein